jgi:carbonic anhydrase/acetyltransferase-like protein (isoleucine patch superfamily)
MLGSAATGVACSGDLWRRPTFSERCASNLSAKERGVRRSEDVRVSAILVINDRLLSNGSTASAKSGRATSRGSMACAEILGRSILDRTAARLQKAGIRNVSIIGGPTIPKLPSISPVEITVTENSFMRWSAAQQTLREHAARGFDTVFVIGVGAYLEFDVIDALKFHFTNGTPLTQLENASAPLDCWIVDSKWFRTAATDCTLPFRYGEFPGLPVPCQISGYVNRLQEARDLRRLVTDVFLSRCEIKPSGAEVKPGVWLDEGARVHRMTRLVAPVYVGRLTTVGPSAVVTRFSNLESNCQIGDGTIVDQSSVLQHTALGRGLDVSDSVVAGNELVDLDRNITVQIDDRNLLSDTTPRDWYVPAHRKFVAHTNRGQGAFSFEYGQYLSRAAGRLSEVFFKG